MKLVRTAFALITLAVTLLGSPPAFAHDQRLHKGKATEGVIISVEPDRFTIKTEGGEKKVTLAEETKFEVGDAAGSRDDLKGGVHVAVFGTKLPGGEIVAKEIVLRGREVHGREGAPHEAHE